MSYMYRVRAFHLNSHNVLFTWQSTWRLSNWSIQGSFSLVLELHIVYSISLSTIVIFGNHCLGIRADLLYLMHSRKVDQPSIRIHVTSRFWLQLGEKFYFSSRILNREYSIHLVKIGVANLHVLMLAWLWG